MGDSKEPAHEGILPIRRYAQSIIEAVKNNPTVVVIGETGSGKTTQISQVSLTRGLGLVFADVKRTKATLRGFMSFADPQ